MFNVEFCKKQMKAVGITKTALADKCGVSTAHMIQVTLGNKNPSVKLVTQMAKVLGCKSTDLWSIEDKLYQKPYEKDVDDEVVDKYDDVQVTCYEPEIKTFDVEEFRARMAEQPIIPEEIPTVNVKGDGVWLDKYEASCLRDWFEMGGLFDIIRQDPDVDSMEWLSAMMCIYAKCKEVA